MRTDTLSLTCVCGCSVWSPSYKHDDDLGDVQYLTCIQCGCTRPDYDDRQKAILARLEEEREARDRAERDAEWEKVNGPRYWYYIEIEKYKIIPAGPDFETAMAHAVWSPACKGRHIRIIREEKGITAANDYACEFEGVV